MVNYCEKTVYFFAKIKVCFTFETFSFYKNLLVIRFFYKSSYKTIEWCDFICGGKILHINFKLVTAAYRAEIWYFHSVDVIIKFNNAIKKMKIAAPKWRTTFFAYGTVWLNVDNSHWLGGISNFSTLLFWKSCNKIKFCVFPMLASQPFSR